MKILITLSFAVSITFFIWEACYAQSSIIDKINSGRPQVNMNEMESPVSKWAKEEWKRAKERKTVRRYEQENGISSNVYSDRDSTGSEYSVCFNFNNQLELDQNARLRIEHADRSGISTDTKGFFGDSCVSGSNLGGLYNFIYTTKSRERRGSFTISGNSNYVTIDLSDFILDNKITVNEN